MQHLCQDMLLSMFDISTEMRQYPGRFPVLRSSTMRIVPMYAWKRAGAKSQELNIVLPGLPMASDHFNLAMAPLAGSLSSELATEWANLSIAQRAEFLN
eukprot:2929537-Ditylum_brightwellii.AAC.2